jgi:hypothetical protein
MLVGLPLVFLLGAILLALGLRGRVVGTDPHCRRCKFNLRGRDPSSARCPECGTELTDASVRVGLRRRRPALVSVGAALALLSGGAIGFVGYQAARGYDWAPWKPTAWLLADVEARSGADYAAAVKELNRRVAAPRANQAKVDAILDRALAHQGDRAARWDPAWAGFLASAAKAGRLSADRKMRYLEQAVTASLATRPKARRGRYLGVELQIHYDRLTTNAQLRGKWETSPLLLDSAVVSKQFVNDRQEHDLGGGTSYLTGLELNEKVLAGLPNGPHALKSAVTQTLTQTEPFAAGPVTVTVPVSTPLELFPKNAIVDDFKVDPEQRSAERAAVLDARVRHDHRGHVEVRIKSASLPVALAANVVLTQGSAEQPIGSLLLQAHQPPHWSTVSRGQRPRFTGDVDVHLRPDQGAADYQRTLGTYWGEEIVIPGIVIDAPYDVPFNTDESLRPAVEAALKRPKVTRGSGPGPRHRLGLSLSVNGAPVKLAYVIVLAGAGRETKVDSGSWIVPAKENYGWSTSADDIDPAGQATSCDVILRPDPDWEARSSDLTPPWGGEVVFHDVKIDSPAPAATKP